MPIDIERLKNDPVAFGRHREVEQARRDEFAKLYPKEAAAIEGSIVSNLPSGVVAQEVLLKVTGRNEEEDEKLNEVRKVHRQMAEIGVIPATVVNLLPWAVQGNGRYLMYPDMTVPECPIGRQFERLVISSYKIDIEDKAGRFGATVLTTISLANDIIAQLEPMKRGGLFNYLGNHLPGEHPDNRIDPETKKTVLCKQSLRELADMAKAKRAMLKNFHNLLHEAEGFFQQPARKSLQNITENHRKAAIYLHHYRLIPVLPAWVTAQFEEGAEAPDACPRCHADLAGGFGCPDCGYIVDPMGAYQAGEIEEEHHAIRRLSRETLDSLDLQHVMTLSEYRAAKRSGELDDDPEPDPAAPKNKRRSRRKVVSRTSKDTELRERGHEE